MQDEEIAVGDIGGTHARFAMARIADGRVRALGPAHVLRVANYPGLAEAWRAFLTETSGAPPRAAALAVATPVRGDVLKFTNSPWRLRRATLAEELGVEQLTLVNDFGAVGHAVAQLGPESSSISAGRGGRSRIRAPSASSDPAPNSASP